MDIETKLKKPVKISEDRQESPEVSESTIINWMQKVHESIQITHVNVAENNKILTKVLHQQIDMQKELDALKKKL